MTRFIGILQTGFAWLLYLLSIVTFVDYMYSLTIPDTVTAIENAFGTLVILIFLLVMAKFSLTAGKQKLQESAAGKQAAGGEKPGAENGLDPGQTKSEEETEK